MKTKRFLLAPAMLAIVAFGGISLLGDTIYEGARSVNGQYFRLLGISATKLGVAFGAGEFLGYFLRLLSGVLSDRTGRHWVFLFTGYGMLLAVPFIGVASGWPLLVVLVLLERIGKAVRSPAKDTLLSGIAQDRLGVGLAFGIQEALDQIGAFAGPILFSLILLLSESSPVAGYRLGYRLLIFPYLLLMALLFWVRRWVMREQLAPVIQDKEERGGHLGPIFRWYLLFVFFASMGLVNFGLIGYHLRGAGVYTDAQIVLLYAGAMAIDALFALYIGRSYDRRSADPDKGLALLGLIPLFTFPIPFLVFRINGITPLIGMVFLGLVLATHETLLRSVIAGLVVFGRRGTAYGLFNAGYGAAFFIGAGSMGWLYDRGQLGWIIGFSVITQSVAILLFRQLKRITTDTSIQKR